ncbi:alpha/beta fold hydrolase [Echinimonas agarilytica]|uniref:Alpha/beta hydrolase n=1 Tax=Echinimonas agarilytica TaxID=1215918 RepID=A0AA41W886_9GAMM|nr:alpha/beta hydrolase [Echinimonas agarilytica]MCM2681057.1 alpha/beta hydrolase [Echinimonas agarilytica]
MIPLIQYSQHGNPLVLSPANGFPPRVYEPLLRQLAPHHQVWLAEHRPLWPGQHPPKNWLDWNHLANDLVQQIEQQSLPPVTLVGHSLGAVLGVLAANKAPHLFRQLILMEPVAFPSFQSHMLRFMPWFVKRKLTMVQKTLMRPVLFKDHDIAFKFHRRARSLRNLSDEALNLYIEHGFEQSPEGLKLRFDKHWEAIIYGSLPNVWPILRTLKVPLVGLKAEFASTVQDKEWRRWQKLRPDHRFEELKGSEHLLALTEPDRVAKLLLDCID